MEWVISPAINLSRVESPVHLDLGGLRVVSPSLLDRFGLPIPGDMQGTMI